MAVDMKPRDVVVNNNNIGEDEDLKNPVFVDTRKSSNDSHTRLDSGYGDDVDEAPVFSDSNKSPPGSPPWATTPQKEQLSPMQQIHNSTGSGPPSKRYGTKFVKDFDQFYKQSYLEKASQGHKTPVNALQSLPNNNVSANQGKPQHFHRPDNFSYSKVRTDFKLPKKGMLSALGDKEMKVPTKGEPYKPNKKQEPYVMSKFSDGQRPDAHLDPIERDDWPGPPCPAAAFPELFYDRATRQRHRHKSSEKTLDDSAGSTGDHDKTDESEGGAGDASMNANVSISVLDDDDEEVPPDPKTDRELRTLASISSESGAAKVVLKEYQKTRMEGVQLDPRSASRTPSASFEPHYATRYDNPVFASPSRDAEFRPRLGSLDDQIMGKKYRNSTLPLSNLPVDRHQHMYELPKNAIPNLQAPRPGYGLKSATLPANGANHTFDEMDGEQRYGRGGSADELQRAHYSSYSSMEEYDPTTGLRRNPRIRGSTLSSSEGYGKAYIGYRRSIPSVYKGEEPPKIYTYEQLLITNPELPPDVERNTIEKHLSKEEFESIFHMSRGDFYRLAEWKRNDLKRRVNLF